MNYFSRLAKLDLARLEDREAKQEAVHCGMVASNPPSAIQLKELCVMGETMLGTSRALAAAEDSFFNSWAADHLTSSLGGDL
jgi:hypothetical protein